VKGRQLILQGHHKGGLYRLDITPVTRTEQVHIAVDINVLHRHMGHIDPKSLKKMVDHGQLEDIDTVTGTPRFCEPCVLGKMRKQPFKHKGQHATHPLQVVHSDVGGPVSPPDRYGNQYWITFTDDYGRFPWIYFMKKKSEALSVFRQWKHNVETFFKTEIGELHLSLNWLDFFQTDNSTEYLNALFKAELSCGGTIHHTTAADTPEQDGLAERMNQTLTTKATAMLIESGLPKSFWSDAMSTSGFLTTHSPALGLRRKTPYTKIFKRKVDASWFRPLGCLAYALIPKPNRPWKFAPKG
jgi:hypothetical protein